MNAWRESQIGDEIELAYGKSLPARARETGDVGVFGSNGLVGNHSTALISGPGIVIGRKGSVGKVVYSHEGFWPIDTTYYVVNKHDHNWRFLYHLLSSVGLDGLNSHSAVPGLNREIAYSIPILLPEKTEQEWIASVLDTIERAVQQERLVLERAQALKRAAMRTLFTRGLRGEAQKETAIGPVPESWDPIVVGSIATVKGGKRMPKGISLTNENTGQPYVRVTDFNNHGVNVKEVLCVPNDYQAAISRYVISSDDIYISIAGTIGLVGQVPKVLDGANLTENAAKLSVSDWKVTPRFLMYALASDTCQAQIAQSTATNAQPKLALVRIEQIQLPMPPKLDEQREVVAILDAIDRKIDLHRRKRAVLEGLFTALLHKLMTGEIRVENLEPTALTTSLVSPLPVNKGGDTINEKGRIE